MSSQTPTRIPLPGTRPSGAHDEGEAARQVRQMFSDIAPRYDFLNHLLSFNLDRVWRRRVAQRFSHILARTEARVLDQCCGTGDLTLALRRTGRATVFGTDFAHPMLALAQQKSNRAGIAGAGLGGFVEADVLQLPFADASFDLATVAFGFRNLANYERGLRETLRVLRPGGEVGILEFAEPRGALFGPLYRFYFTRILPRVGRAFSRNSEAYSYLPSSVEVFPSPEDLTALMSRAGFADARSELWTGGIVALHTGRRA